MVAGVSTTTSSRRCRSTMLCVAAVALACVHQAVISAASLAWLMPGGSRLAGRPATGIRAQRQVRQLFGGGQKSEEEGEPVLDEARLQQEKEKVEKLQAEIDELTQHAEDKKNAHERLSMEISNFRSRTAKELNAARSKAAVPVIKELMGIADEFEMAKANLKTESDGEKAIVDKFTVLFDKMMANWKQLGFEKMSSVGEVFDPELHEAVTMLPSADYKDGVVSNAYREGWKLKTVGVDKPEVLRAALVVVSSGPGP